MPGPSSAPRGRPPIVWAALAAFSLAAIAVAIGLSYRRAPATAPTRTELTRLSPDDEHSYLGPAISPDGKLVAYSSNRSGKWELWLQQPGGDPPVQLTHSDRVVGGPSFFPDGKRILYATTSPAEDDTTIEIIPSTGGEPQKLWSGNIVTSAVDLRGPTVSPDGSRVAFLEQQRGGRLRLMVMSTTGDRPRPVPGFDRLQMWPGDPRLTSWTTDGRSVLYLAASASGGPVWEWFAVPVDGGEPVELMAGQALRRAGFDVVSPAAVFGNRALFWGSFTRPHIFDVPLSTDTWKISGPPRQLTFGTGRFDPTTVSHSGVAAIERPLKSIDFYAIPVDKATGHASAATRRLTREGLGAPVFDVGGEPDLSYVVMWENRDSGLIAKALRLRLDTGEAAPLGPIEVDREGSWTVSRDGRLIAHSRPERKAYSISITDMTASTTEARVLCHDCGLAQAFSPDGRSVFYQPEASSAQASHPKTSIHLMDVTTGSHRPWIEDRVESLGVKGLTGSKGEWVVVSATTPGARGNAARTFLVPWRNDPVPRAEWIDVVGENLKFSPATDLAYFFDGPRLMAMRFDPKTRQMGAPYEVRLASGSQPVLKPDDDWVVRGPGIVFSPTDIKGSVWLLKMTNEQPR